MDYPNGFTQFYTATGLVRVWVTGHGKPDESVEGTAVVPGVYHVDDFWFPDGEPVPRPDPVVPRLKGRDLDLGDLPLGTPCRVTTPEGDRIDFDLDATGVRFRDPGAYLFEADPPLPYHRVGPVRLEVE